MNRCSQRMVHTFLRALPQQATRNGIKCLLAAVKAIQLSRCFPLPCLLLLGNQRLLPKDVGAVQTIFQLGKLLICDQISSFQTA